MNASAGRPTATRALPGLCLLALFSFALPAKGDDWPQLRGPEQNSTAQGQELRNAVSVDFEVVWRQPLGSGYSSVVVKGDTAVTAATVIERGEPVDVVVAIDPQSGQRQWSYQMAPVFRGRNGSDDGPSSSPTLGRNKVYSLHPGGRLVALALDTGELLWERHLIDDFGGRLPTYGYSTAPLLVRDRLFVQAGGSQGRLMVALDADSGALLWSAGEDSVAIEHQNPMFWQGPGGEQILVVSPSALSSFRFSDGALVFSYPLEGRGHAGDITIVDDHRFLLHRHNEDSRLIAVEQTGETSTPRELWTTDSLDRSYAPPIVHKGHIYGFDQRFLVCLELETGELRYKSRPPGGRVLSLIGDQLLVVNDLGELVAVAADPEGYRETGRSRLFRGRMVMTPVTWSTGLLFVRNLEEVVALRPQVTKERLQDERDQAPTLTDESEKVPIFLRQLLDEVGAGGIEAALLSRYETFPIVDRGQAHFLWIGDEPDVAVVGDMTFFYREIALQRLAGTRVRWASFDAPPSERWEYVFKLFEDERLDPRNPTSIQSIEGKRSVLVLPGYQEWQPPSCPGCATGSLTQVEVASQTPGRSYEMTVYTPASSASTTPLPLLIMADGIGALGTGGGEGNLPLLLDSLIGRGEIEPLIVAFLALPEAAWYSTGRDRLVEILDQDLMPYLDREYELAPEPSKRAMVAQRWAADNSLFWALESAAIGLYAIQSPAFGETTIVRALEPAAREARPLVVRIDLGHFDQKNSDYGLDVERQSRELAELLAPHGHRVEIVETEGGANWTRWRKELGNILPDFFPATP